MLKQQEKRIQLYGRFAEKSRRNVWNSYDRASCQRIADAVDAEAASVWRCKDDFEVAAWWYRAGLRRPLRTVRSKKLERLKRVIKHADLLLRSLDIRQIRHHKFELLLALNIKSLNDAYDGVGDNFVSFEIFETLASVEPCNEDVVANAVRSIALSHDIDEILDGAAEIGRRAIEASSSIGHFSAGDWQVPIGNQRDAALNEWIVYAMGLYVKIAGNPPGTSVTKPGYDREGVAGGPLIRFLMAAGRELHTREPSARPKYERRAVERHRRVLESEGALRSRLRRLLLKLAGKSAPLVPH